MKPILFNTDMVRATQEDRKTVTRRVIKNKDIINGWDCEADGTPIAYINQATGDSHPTTMPCPYQPGDILWVRETWRATGVVSQPYAYRATEDDLHLIGEDGRALTLKYRWYPSIHMPKEAARLFLRVKAVRVERLLDIAEEQAVMEGIFLDSPDFIPTYHYDKNKCNVPGAGWNTARESFLWGLWDSTVKPTDRTVYGHFANPWVWVIEFERVSREAALAGGGGDGV